MIQLALLGTGLMGAPMARNLVRAGHDLRVWNRSPDKARAVEGAQACDAAGDAVAGAEIVISMLADGPASEAVEMAAADGFADGAIWVEMASIRPAEARAAGERFAGRGMGYVDAPVSGGTKGAEAGTLAIMAGGDADAFARVERVGLAVEPVEQARVEVGREHLRALRDEHLGRGPADALARGGDQGALALQSIGHSILPVVLRAKGFQGGVQRRRRT